MVEERRVGERVGEVVEGRRVGETVEGRWRGGGWEKGERYRGRMGRGEGGWGMTEREWKAARRMTDDCTCGQGAPTGLILKHH